MTDNLTWDIGAVRVTRVEEQIVPMLWEDLIPEGSTALESCRPWIDPFVDADGSHLLLSIHSFIVETPKTLIVVDTCVGDTARPKFRGDERFGERLAAALPGGLDAVDRVVCTHLHFDHVGWNTVERDGVLVPTFPNARYLVTAAELASERDEEDTTAFERAIAPLQEAACLDAVPSDHQIDQWVSLTDTAGHTPGHVSVRIQDGDAGALITGDIVHSPLQLAHPAVSSTPDRDPALAIETRRRIVDEHSDTGTLILGTHFAPPTAGHLKSSVDHIRFD